ncbi:hypothetical protein BDZ45DRAFT_8484 [Acephala macrosclerotiorum]|nr:hypothetical protein BDZ45DRAFT_8484 [Acephala macrosclerotiorum]
MDRFGSRQRLTDSMKRRRGNTKLGQLDYSRITTETSAFGSQLLTLRSKSQKKRQKRPVLTLSTSRQIDCDLEVISDNEVPAQEVPPQLALMIQNSVNTRTPIRYDWLDLPYPDVKLVGGSGMHIIAVVVKSVIQFAVIENDLVVEMAVYRRFLGPGMEPEMSVGVSMYKHLWDSTHMRSLHGTTENRSWEDPLKTFFGYSHANGEVIDGSKGVEKFLAEVETIQGFLADAIKHAECFRTQTQDTWEAGAEASQPSEALQVNEPGTLEQNSSYILPGDVWTMSAVENGPSSPFSPAGHTQTQLHAAEVEDIYSAD